MKSNHEQDTYTAACPVCGVTHILRYGRHHTRCVCGAELGIIKDWSSGKLLLVKRGGQDGHGPSQDQ